MGRNDRAHHASRAARGTDAGEIEIDEQALAVESGKANVECVCEAMFRISVHDSRREHGADAVPQSIAKPSLPCLFFGEVTHCGFGGDCEPDDSGDVLRAGSAFAFMRTTDLHA